MSVKIFKVDSLPTGFEGLLADASKEGFSFLDKMKTAWESGSNKFNKQGELFLAAFVDGELAGVGGRSIDPHIENGLVGRVRHLYVSPSFRKQGVGKALVSEILKEAEEFFMTMRLSTENSGTSDFCKKVGFTEATKEHQTHFIDLD